MARVFVYMGVHVHLFACGGWGEVVIMIQRGELNSTGWLLSLDLRGDCT